MAEASKTQYFDELLNLLDIKEYYPEKLTREKLYEITPESLSSDKKSVTAVWQFIDKITRYNYHARNIQTQNAGAGTKPKSFQEKRKIQRDSSILNVHPLDVLAAVFLCCDPIAKQDLVMHLWGCKLSIPFAIQPSKDERLLVYLWPLRSLIGQFQELDTWVETSLIDKSMKSVAFLRVGENEYSKSSLLNSIIGGSEKPHPMFFNRNSEGSKRKKSDLTNGLVEIGWFLSSDNDEGQLTKPHIFFNLRGDATKNLSQVELIGQLATVTIVLCSLCNLENSKGILKILCENKSRIIILISDQKPDFTVISTFLDNSFSHLSETQMDIITIEEDMICEVLESLHHVISKMESDDGRELVLSDFAKNLPSMKYRVDETEIHYTEAFEISSDILREVRDTKEEKRKDTLLPLQERFWKKWAQMDRDLARFDQLDPSKRKRYGNITNLQKDMFKTRQSQYFHLKKNGLSAPMKLFVGAFVKLNYVSRKIFLRMVKLQLDILSRKTLKPFYDEYQELLKQTIDATEHERISIQKQLLDLDTKKAKFSFGLEHFIRELGQTYEACLYHSEDNISIFCGKDTELPYEEIPRFACLALLEGYPVEILDGEACYVPTRWIKGVFSILPQCLDVQKPQAKSKVYVISVLGIQSSGKSTFLNTIFGLQFAVSAGRCTEGVYMQLIKLHKSLDSNAEYILAIDTEGLKAAKLTTTESIQHDNEMSTFVIGLADTTVINLMGENATYLQENLPIAVHAFLRMNLVGLHPRCNIVHHNVDERNRQKLLEQTRILENCLNQLTSTACEVEQIPRRLFKDIIKFNITDHTDYIPALFEGGQPMAPINIGYSKQSDKVRKKLIEFMPPYDEMFSLTDFAKHIEILWNAINKDSFVFEFKTTLETEAKLDLDKGFFQILKQFLEKVDEKAVKYKRKLNM
ncbi:interferon-induced very large GTPase 1-like [Mercenaria mercenaria]|uniref:interferon-induced very large GTPase 1-like n=1 Tax=Mercenaria mercenaria TaxID=6596 RepID=UPI00234EFD5B|nr:interferon-induced very large GTPase 1-like [Mercenaria mercenaria]XP_053386427.1 interferon-induced very large GTPase 1-like [Mercenaria mercenaria]